MNNTFELALATLTTPESLSKIKETIDECYNSPWLDAQLLEFFGPTTKRTSSAHFVEALYSYINNQYPSNEIIYDIHTLVCTLYPRLEYRQQVFVRLRKALVAAHGTYPEPPLLTITRDEYKSIVAGQRARRDKRNCNRLEVSKYIVMDIIKEGMDVLAPAPVRAAALLLASGARPIELAERSSFLPVKDKPSHIIQRCPAKKRDKDNTVEFEKPLIGCDYATFAAALYLSSHLGVLDICKLANTFYNSCGVPLTAQLSRKVYGNLSYELFAETNKITINEWLKQMLCHENAETSLNYTSVYLSENLIQEPLSKSQGSQTLGHPSVLRGSPRKTRQKVDQTIHGHKERRQMLKDKIQELQEKGLKVNQSMLKRCGFGYELISKVFIELGLKKKT